MWLLLITLCGPAPRAPTRPAGTDTIPDSLPAKPATAPWIFGGTFDRYLVEGYQLSALSFRTTRLRPDHWTSDAAIGMVFDRGPGDPAVFTLDLGLAYNGQAPGSTLLIRLGATSLFAAQGGGVVGAYGGLGAILPLSRDVGLRVEGSRRWYLVTDGDAPAVWLVSVGFTSLGGRSPR
jgi:hypothetical protein